MERMSELYLAVATTFATALTRQTDRSLENNCYVTMLSRQSLVFCNKKRHSLMQRSSNAYDLQRAQFVNIVKQLNNIYIYNQILIILRLTDRNYHNNDN